MGDVEQVIKAPRHPYTQLLVRSIPLPDPERRWGEDPNGAHPSPHSTSGTTKTIEESAHTEGCAFADRCPHVMSRCRRENPSLLLTDSGRAAACYLYEEATLLSEEEIAQLSHGGS